MSTFYLQNPSATVGGGLLALGFAPSCKSFSIKEGLGCKKAQMILLCPTVRTIVKLIKMEVRKRSARKLTNQGKGNLTMLW